MRRAGGTSFSSQAGTDLYRIGGERGHLVRATTAGICRGPGAPEVQDVENFFLRVAGERVQGAREQPRGRRGVRTDGGPDGL